MDVYQEMYAEETRDQLLSANKELQSLTKEIQKLNDKYVPPSDEVTVKNPTPATDLDYLEKQVSDMAERLENAIKSIPETTEVSVKNIDQAKTETVTVSNLNDLAKQFDALKAAVKDAIATIELAPIINVEKQDLDLPQLASQAIPVRLSDGKKFYTAQLTAVSGAMQEVDPLVGYQPTDKDASSDPKYWGFTRKNGSWYIMEENVSNGTYRYAFGTPNDAQGGGLYTDAWADRANLTYQRFYEAY